MLRIAQRWASPAARSDVRKNYKFFSRYEFQHEPLNGAFVGVGYNYVNRRAGDAGNTFFHEPYGVWEGLIGYGADRWSVQMNVYNLTEEIYSRASVNNLFIVPGPQRTFRFTARYTF
jgi:outer membrane receptor for ferric coprogen and ferric-rhodotorulic acid